MLPFPYTFFGVRLSMAVTMARCRASRSVVSSKRLLAMFSPGYQLVVSGSFAALSNMASSRSKSSILLPLTTRLNKRLGRVAHSAIDNTISSPVSKAVSNAVFAQKNIADFRKNRRCCVVAGTRNTSCLRYLFRWLGPAACWCNEVVKRHPRKPGAGQRGRFSPGTPSGTGFTRLYPAWSNALRSVALSTWRAAATSIALQPWHTCSKAHFTCSASSALFLPMYPPYSTNTLNPCEISGWRSAHNPWASSLRTRSLEMSSTGAIWP